jgi:hypothetical protein
VGEFIKTHKWKILSINGGNVMNLKDPILKVVSVDTDCHFSHLLPKISAFKITKEAVKEFEETLCWAITRAKGIKDAVLINLGGEYDLVVTEYRLHLMKSIETYELPKIIE